MAERQGRQMGVQPATRLGAQSATRSGVRSGAGLAKICVVVLVLMTLLGLVACSSGGGSAGQAESAQEASSAASVEPSQSDQEAQAAKELEEKQAAEKAAAEKAAAEKKAVEEAAAKKAAEEAAAKEKAAADAKAKLEAAKLEPTTSVLEYSDKTTDPMKLVTCSDDSVQIAVAGAIDLSKLGKQDVAYTLAADGQSLQRTITFEVRDTKKPKIELDKESVTIELGASYDPLTNVKSVADPVDGDLKKVDAPPETKGAKAGEEQFYGTGWYVVEGQLNSEKAGKYFLTIRAQDRNGNEASKQFTVLVNAPKTEQAQAGATQESNGITYVVNVNSRKFHYPDCPSTKKMKPENRKDSNESRDELINEGYKPCGNCNP